MMRLRRKKCSLLLISLCSCISGLQRETPRCKVSPKTEKSRVFIHSMPKTGTSSMGYALELLGYNDCGSRTVGEDAREAIRQANDLVKGYGIGQVPESALHEARTVFRTVKVKKVVEELQKKDHVNKEGERVPLVSTVTCNSYSDFPIGHATGMDLRLKMMLWPNSTYIWIDRPFDEWRESYLKQKLRHNKTVHCDYMDRDFIAERRRELLELEKLVPGSVIFLNTTSLDWEHLLPGLPLKEAHCDPPSKDFPHVNTEEDNGDVDRMRMWEAYWHCVWISSNVERETVKQIT